VRVIIQEEALRRSEGHYYRHFIQELPTIDAEPVRHGVWIKREAVFKGNEIKVDRLECSECGKTQRRFLDTPYCPNCGAKMDLKEEDK